MTTARLARWSARCSTTTPASGSSRTSRVLCWTVSPRRFSRVHSGTGRTSTGSSASGSKRRSARRSGPPNAFAPRRAPAPTEPQLSGCARLWVLVPTTPAYRFGIGGLPAALPELREAIRRYEDAGFDFVAKGDHVGSPSPFSLLTAAAAVSERLRLRTYVLNVSFWNPVLLARDAATLDRLSGGRLELGLGAGTIKREFDTARIPWQPQ